MNKFTFTPYDIALFIISENFRRSEELIIKESIWSDKQIETRYKAYKNHFFRDIDRCLEQLCNSDFFEETASINKIFSDIGSDFAITILGIEESKIDTYFKLIRLKLTYCPQKSYVRIKMRAFLKDFNYKRRQPDFLRKARNSMRSFEILSYTKGNNLCDIRDVNIDDVFILRLK